ncbi:hypothetical protein V2H45_17600, partial [Tumidithrix elongata RA019]|nr:hypothetical protein [Tumidithrix elongata RA019]
RNVGSLFAIIKDVKSVLYDDGRETHALYWNRQSKSSDRATEFSPQYEPICILGDKTRYGLILEDSCDYRWIIAT